MTAITLTSGGPPVHVTVYQYDQLVGGTISNGGMSYAVDDTITLAPIGGSQLSPAVITVEMVSAGVVTAFSVTTAGVFSTNPTSFAQASTSGSGSGFTISPPSFAPIAQFPYQIAWNLDALLQPITITPDASGFNFQAPVGMLPMSVPANAVAVNTASGGVGTLQVMVVDSTMTFTSP